MTTHVIYDAPAGTGNLKVTARPGMAEGYLIWLVKFNRSWGEAEKRSRCRRSGAAVTFASEWLPDLNMWRDQRFVPRWLCQIPPAALATVETWLRALHNRHSTQWRGTWETGRDMTNAWERIESAADPVTYPD
jgi:hypothetical protein